MEEKANRSEDRRGPLWAELRRKAKNDPEMERHLEAIKQGLHENQEVLQQLADF